MTVNLFTQAGWLNRTQLYQKTANLFTQAVPSGTVAGNVALIVGVITGGLAMIGTILLIFRLLKRRSLQPEVETPKRPLPGALLDEVESRGQPAKKKEGELNDLSEPASEEGDGIELTK
jgi:hypothetical protein